MPNSCMSACMCVRMFVGMYYTKNQKLYLPLKWAIRNENKNSPHCISSGEIYADEYHICPCPYTLLMRLNKIVTADQPIQLAMLYSTMYTTPPSAGMFHSEQASYHTLR